jgi:hypothetical protein
VAGNAFLSRLARVRRNGVRVVAADKKGQQHDGCHGDRQAAKRRHRALLQEARRAKRRLEAPF